MLEHQIILIKKFLGKNIIPKNVKFGENVSCGQNLLFYGTAPIIVGDRTMIGARTIIMTATHDYNLHPMSIKRIDRPVEIGKHVWIGAGAIIHPGVKIGDYAVVGSGSIVTKHVPQGAIVAGNPAKIIKWRDLVKINENKDTLKSGEFLSEELKDFLPEDKKCQPFNS